MERKYHDEPITRREARRLVQAAIGVTLPGADRRRFDEFRAILREIDPEFEALIRDSDPLYVADPTGDRAALLGEEAGGG